MIRSSSLTTCCEIASTLQAKLAAQSSELETLRKAMEKYVLCCTCMHMDQFDFINMHVRCACHNVCRNAEAQKTATKEVVTLICRITTSLCQLQSVIVQRTIPYLIVKLW